MRIAIAQLSAKVGDLAGNVSRIIDFAQRARTGGAHLMVTPELAICGYPPEDVLLRDEFMHACASALAHIAASVHGITLVVGHPRLEGLQRYNSASVVLDGRVLGVYDKHKLADYTVFDEARYFESGDRACVVTLEGIAFGVNICADMWQTEAPHEASAAGARILLVLNASPYHARKLDVRHQVMRERARETGLAIVYANMVGSREERLFDGASFVMDAEGTVTHQLPAFEEALAFAELG